MSIELSQPLVAFLCEELNVPPLRLTATTRLLQDLGVDGDDGVELIKRFSLRYGVNLAGFDPALHFGPEAGVTLSFGFGGSFHVDGRSVCQLRSPTSSFLFDIAVG